MVGIFLKQEHIDSRRSEFVSPNSEYVGASPLGSPPADEASSSGSERASSTFSVNSSIALFVFANYGKGRAWNRFMVYVSWLNCVLLQSVTKKGVTT